MHRCPPLLNEDSMKKSSPISSIFKGIFRGTDPIFMDFSANSVPILVEYNYLHVPPTHGCFV